jgi:hypothetical protein
MQFIFSISIKTHKIIKPRMLKLTERQKADLSDDDIIVS